MKMFYTILLFSMFFGSSYEEEIISATTEERVFEGEGITLSCNYTGSYSTDTLLWYQQYPRSKPEFLLLITEGGLKTHNESTHPRLSVKLNDEKTRVDLEITSAEVTDSALYYCALTGAANKIIFGTGTKVIVNSREKHDPSYYSLKSSNTTACLATDFSAHNATAHLESFNKTEATRVKGDSYYSQVALGENCTEGGGSEKCEANWYFDTDAKINFLSLTILGLRILFLKTIVFNVLMTLRLWMS